MMILALEYPADDSRCEGQEGLIQTILSEVIAAVDEGLTIDEARHCAHIAAEAIASAKTEPVN